MPEILATTVDIVRRELERSRAPRCYPDITATSAFERDLLCSTIDLVCIAHEVEEQFGVELPGECLEGCDTVGDLAALIRRLPAGVRA